MARVSTKENKNIYHKTREALHLTRESASELLEFIAPERIERIENERCFPHPEEVLMMAKQYKQPDLCNYYCANQCPIGQQYVPEVGQNQGFISDRSGNAGLSQRHEQAQGPSH